jgi:hypothetical protein
MTMTDTIQLTLEQIAQYRVELADNPDFLAALDVIEEWDGDLADAAESIATRNGIEGVEDKAAGSRWFVTILQKCRAYICQPKYERLREDYFPAVITPLTDCIAASLGCPPGVAGILSAPIALYISEEGMDKFCQISTDS